MQPSPTLGRSPPTPPNGDGFRRWSRGSLSSSRQSPPLLPTPEVVADPALIVGQPAHGPKLRGRVGFLPFCEILGRYREACNASRSTLEYSLKGDAEGLWTAMADRRRAPDTLWDTSCPLERHRRLAAPFCIRAFGVPPRHIAAPSGEPHRLFVGQVPYNISLDLIRAIFFILGDGTELASVERIVRWRSGRQPAGCLHIYVPQSDAAAALSLDQVVLLDDGGCWLATEDRVGFPNDMERLPDPIAQAAVLSTFLSQLRATPSLRAEERPFQAMSVQEAKSTYASPALQSSGPTSAQTVSREDSYSRRSLPSYGDTRRTSPRDGTHTPPAACPPPYAVSVPALVPQPIAFAPRLEMQTSLERVDSVIDDGPVVRAVTLDPNVAAYLRGPTDSQGSFSTHPAFRATTDDTSTLECAPLSNAASCGNSRGRTFDAVPTSLDELSHFASAGGSADYKPDEAPLPLMSSAIPPALVFPPMNPAMQYAPLPYPPSSTLENKSLKEMFPWMQ